MHGERHVPGADPRANPFADECVESGHGELPALETQRRQVELEVVGSHRCFDDGSRFETSGIGLEIEPSHDGIDIARANAISVGQHNQRVGKPRDFRNGMADVNDGDVEFVAQELDVVENLHAARNIERGERLVEQQDARLRQQRPADGDPLFLAAGKRTGLPAEQRIEAEDADHAARFDEANCRRAQMMSVQEIAFDRQVRKEQ